MKDGGRSPVHKRGNSQMVIRETQESRDQKLDENPTGVNGPALFAEVGQLVVEDDPGPRRKDPRAEAVGETSKAVLRDRCEIPPAPGRLLGVYRHVVDAAGGGRRRAVLRQHRHVGGAHALHVGRDVVVLGLVGGVALDQTPDAVGKAFLRDFPGHLPGERREVDLALDVKSSAALPRRLWG